MRLSYLNHVMAVFAAAVFSYRDTDTELDATVDATIDDDNIVLASAINRTKKMKVITQTECRAQPQTCGIELNYFLILS